MKRCDHIIWTSGGDWRYFGFKSLLHLAFHLNYYANPRNCHFIRECAVGVWRWTDQGNSRGLAL